MQRSGLLWTKTLIFAACSCVLVAMQFLVPQMDDPLPPTSWTSTTAGDSKSSFPSSLAYGTPGWTDRFFISMGDFGTATCARLKTHKECRAGVQAKVAATLRTYAELFHPRLILGLGDNFYPDGVTSTADEAFDETFSAIYSCGSGSGAAGTNRALRCASRLAATPFLMALGDHDHCGSVSAQLEFGARSGGKFLMPAPYYVRSFEFHLADSGSGSDGGETRDVKFIVTDSVGLEGGSLSAGERRFAAKLDASLAGPTAARRQWAWLEAELHAALPATLASAGDDAHPPALAVVVGHRPILSLAARPRTGPELHCGERLAALLTASPAALYITGHDHTMQHFVLRSTGGSPASPSNSTAAHNLHCVVNGVGGFNLHPLSPLAGAGGDPAGAEAGSAAETMARRARAALRWRQNVEMGFVLHEVTRDGMVLRFIGAERGELLHTVMIER